MPKFFLLLSIMIALGIAPLSAQNHMDNEQMEKILKEMGKNMGGETGSWHVFYKDHILLVVTDEANNRMRIFTPIVEEKELDAQEMRKLLVANFHSALDAKYSIYEGFLISTFTHPLAELTDAQLKDALRQVVNLADSYGTTYSSTDLIFGGGEEQVPDKRINQSPSKEKRS